MTVSVSCRIERGDRNMAPTYPGIIDSLTLDDWNPPFRHPGPAPHPQGG